MRNNAAVAATYRAMVGSFAAHPTFMRCGESVPYRAGRTGAEICSVRSRSVMSTTVTIGAVSS